jgi:outer membrane protein assembly factor BamE (lipoprotein component of BamABCDE complex)
VAAFKLFNLVKLGMTKTEVNKALGVEGKSNNDEDAKNNTFDYLDDQACGVKVAFSADNKAYSRMIIYNDPASTFGTLSAKPVTEDQYHQIDPGMAYSEVVALLGGPAIVTKEAADQKDCASNIIRTVDWGNADGSYIELTLNSDGTVNEASYQDYQPE